MTQIVGIVCKDSIIIGSESQYTIRESGKQWNQPKMEVIEFSDQNQVLVALAGAVQPALRVINLMRESAVLRPMNSEIAVIDVAKDAIKKYRNEVLSFYNQPLDLVASEQDKIFASEDQYFELMIACLFGKPPNKKQSYLYKIGLLNGQPERVMDCGLMGSGSGLARFMLDQFECNDLIWREALPLVVEALERIKGSDVYCGGLIKIAKLDPKYGPFPTRIIFMTPGDIRPIVEELESLRPANRAWYLDKFSKLINKINDERCAEAEEQEKADEAQAAQRHAAANVNNPVTINQPNTNEKGTDNRNE